MILIKPYLLRALYAWCTDNKFTPYIAVKVDNHTRVPQQFMHNHEIILNISFNATNNLQIGNDSITFLTRFSGKSYKIIVPVNNVLAIYAHENRQGIAFATVTDKPIEGEAAFSSLTGNQYCAMTPNENQGLLYKHQLQKDEIKKPAVEMRILPLQNAKEIQIERISDSDDVAAANTSQKNMVRGRKHLKVIK
ncbi:ClpXP protease specificity-enhancing factor [Candidatus Vallotia lariciata]|uniref:ClpXP protease specificity-enhancing factor n=1 Tax=Candidatus Vallotia laricis TaxID=2018052 RepID=UPI001D032C28|nr:ClpXP protease specificity-enhancing factor [Candidatus Vallotia lariciata]UDG82772.1 Stringent starvation protein B [Candidatus Vallotia lariciata]